MNMQRIAAAALLLVSLPALSQPDDRRASDLPRSPVVTVSASADVAIDPDRAVVRLGVTAEAADAGEAQDQVNTIMAQVIEAVNEVDIPERAVQTEGLTLYPVYRDSRPRPADQEDSGPRITGYQASNIVSIEVARLERIGDVIDAAIGAGANQLQGISFSTSDDAGARADAMRLAVANARLQAESIAEALGMRVDGVREVVAGGYDIRPPRPYYAEQGQRMAMDMASTPVQPGEVEISASVSITYELAPAR